jgi:hypothetical protein
MGVKGRRGEDVREGRGERGGRGHQLAAFQTPAFSNFDNNTYIFYAI